MNGDVGRCPTPDKKQFRSHAEAARFQRDRNMPGRSKNRLWPYECPSGEHWHLTHHSPETQAETGAKVQRRAMEIEGFDAAAHNFEGRELRHLLIDDEPWFVAADVARALGYRDANTLTRRIDPDDKGTRSVRTPGGRQELIVLSEAGLYVAILGSQVADALRFKRWVTHTVLPSIRKTGRYESDHANIALPDRKTLAQWVVDAETRAEVAEAKVIELAAPASAWNELAESAGDYSVSDAAKVLSRDPNIDTGERRLYQFMSGLGWVFKRDGRWRAYQAQVGVGRLVEKVGRPFWHDGRGETVAGEPTVRVTPKGLAELHKRLNGDGQLALIGAIS